LLGSSLVVALACFVLRLQYAVAGRFDILQHQLNQHELSARQLGPLRLLSFAAFAVVLYWICSKIQWDQVASKPFRLLAFVGRHSLPVFAWSILVTYLALGFFPRYPSAAETLLGTVAVLASLVIPAQVRATIRQHVAPCLPRRTSPRSGTAAREPLGS
jgi:peptidoglycan/LPS O-acetylase OafA/YrhL